MERRTAVSVLLSVALIGATVGVLVLLDGAGQRPDVLVISINSLRADRLPCYGHDRNTAPNICAVAEDGTRYTQAFSQFYWTTPSEASIQSGLYPAVHEVYNPEGAPVPLPSTPMMSEVLSGEGYGTYGMLPIDRWTYRNGTGLTRGFEGIVPGADVSSMPGWIIDRLTSSGPAFVYALPMGLHRPYTDDGTQTGDRYTAGYNGTLTRFLDAEGDLPAQFLDNSTWGPEGLETRYRGQVIELMQEDITYLRGLYDNTLRHIDRHVGDIVDGLRQAGAYDETLIIITAPHGETLADDRLYPRGNPFGHLYNYEEVLRVPLIIKPPGGSPVRTVDEPVELIDLYPTVLDHAGIEAPEVLQGSSVRPPVDAGEGYTFSGRRVVRNESWKFMEMRPTFPDPLVLYNRSLSPEERVDVSERYPGVVEDMSSRLRDWQERNELLRSQLAGE